MLNFLSLCICNSSTLKLAPACLPWGRSVQKSRSTVTIFIIKEVFIVYIFSLTSGLKVTEYEDLHSPCKLTKGMMFALLRNFQLYVFCGVNVSWCYYSSGYPILYYPYNYGTIYYPRLTLPVTGGLQHLSSPEVQDINSPTTKAALAYLSESLQLDSCGQMTEAFMSSIQAGSSRQAAGEAAAAVYQRNQRTGGPLSPACASAEVAWRKAVAGGQDPVFPAALAYVEASTSDSPCLASAKDYLKVR